MHEAGITFDIATIVCNSALKKEKGLEVRGEFLR